MMEATHNERAQRAAECSPGWSEAEPWVTVPSRTKARISGRQSYGTARGSERVKGIIDLPARYRERFCTDGSLSSFTLQFAIQTDRQCISCFDFRGGH